MQHKMGDRVMCAHGTRHGGEWGKIVEIVPAKINMGIESLRLILDSGRQYWIGSENVRGENDCQQINEAVHETFTICGNQHSWTLQYHNKPMGMDHWSCMKCPAYVSVPHRTLPSQAKDIEVPDYVNDPRLWWPLASELIRADMCFQYDGDMLYIGHAVCDPPTRRTSATSAYKHDGRAICLAYLTYKQGKDNIESDAVPT